MTHGVGKGWHPGNSPQSQSPNPWGPGHQEKAHSTSVTFPMF